ncbi:hypothetical protein P7K49_029508 [Saguinus oedipus]|uniref:Uncharacterized protein n=1 Tax=Saguinus oedipus TaxID=9490 RepID=A0ABQ9U866_SAGOE|nr:hypothetical protein P7K49_029508 [Saguinus oedipus]
MTSLTVFEEVRGSRQWDVAGPFLLFSHGKPPVELYELAMALRFVIPEGWAVWSDGISDLWTPLPPLPGPRNLVNTTDSAHSPIHSRRLIRHRFRTTDSSWRNPSRALAAGLTHPRRSISTWAHLGPRPTMRRKVPRIAMLPRSPSSAKISLAVAKDFPTSRPE